MNDTQRSAWRPGLPGEMAERACAESRRTIDERASGGYRRPVLIPFQVDDVRTDDDRIQDRHQHREDGHAHDVGCQLRRATETADEDRRQKARAAHDELVGHAEERLVRFDAREKAPIPCGGNHAFAEAASLEYNVSVASVIASQSYFARTAVCPSRPISSIDSGRLISVSSASWSRSSLPA